MFNSPVRAAVFSVATIVLGTVTALAAKTPAWVKLNPPSSPPALSSVAMAYDPISKKVVSFGGWDGASYHDDTWLFDGTTWTQVFSTATPPVRAAAAITFDQVTGNLIMFGGFNGNNYLGDTWIWDGSTQSWTQANPAHMPTAVTLPMMFSDPVNGHAEMIGGWDGQFYQDITWQWSGTDWIQLNPATVPYARGAAVVANDIVHKKVVLFGGLADINPNNTWTWDGTNWTMESPATQPPWTYYSSAAFVPGLNSVVVFGGAFMGNTTWSWTGSNWVTIPTLYAPRARWSLGMAYDSDSNQLLIFGGENSVLLNDTYKLAGR